MPKFWQVDTRKVCVESLQPHVTNMYAITYVAGVYKREIGRFVDRALIASIVCSTFLKICPIGRQNRLINDIYQMDYSIEMKTSVPFSL